METRKKQAEGNSQKKLKANYKCTEFDRKSQLFSAATVRTANIHTS